MEYRFDRYRHGRKMAEGLVLTKPKTVDDAVAVASRLAEAGDVFVLREDLARLAAVEAERDAAQKRMQDCETRMMRYAIELAEMQDERDAARAEAERAVEALDVFARAYRVSMLPFAPGIDEADGAYHHMPHGWPSVADFKIANEAMRGPAFAWLAQREAKAIEAERRANTDVIRSLGPEFCDFVFDGPGAIEYLSGVLAQREREAAAAELEGMWERWCSNESYEPNFSELWRFVSDRAAALRAGKGDKA